MITIFLNNNGNLSLFLLQVISKLPLLFPIFFYLYTHIYYFLINLLILIGNN